MERKTVTAQISLNLSVAFDTVDYSIRLTTLNRNFGIDGMALGWIRNNLAPKVIKIKLGEAYSERKEFTFTVPQGSCVGAFFFNMYCSTIRKVLDPNLGLLTFADDHAIVKKFNPNKQAGEIKLIDLLRAT